MYELGLDVTGEEYHVETVFEVAGWVVFAYEWRHDAMGLRRVYG